MPFTEPLDLEEVRKTKEKEKLLSEAKSKNWRAVFAMFVFTIFACGIAGLLWQSAVVLCIAMYITIAACIWAGLGVSVLNRCVAKLFMKTNNRWFLWMCIFVLTTAIYLVFTPFGGHQASETSVRYAKKLDAVTLSETAQRLNNAKKYGRNSTDQELIDQGIRVVKPAKPMTSPTLTNSTPTDSVRKNWMIRFTALVVLILLTATYFFFAFADEAKELKDKTVSMVREKSEGDVVKTLATTGSAVVSSTLGATGGGLVNKAIDEVAWNTAIDNGQKYLKKFGNYIMRGVKG